MNNAKRQHYVPQFCLREFGIKKGSEHRLFVYDLLNDNSFSTTVYRSAKEKGYYDVKNGDSVVATADKALTDFEDKVAPIYKLLIQHMNPYLLDSGQREYLATFFSTMMSRVPRSREFTKQLAKTMRRELRDQGVPNVEQYILSSSQKREFDISMIRKSAEEFTPVIYDMEWRVCLVGQELNLYISDCPLVMYNPEDHGSMGKLGLKVRGIQLYYPLTPYLLLMMYRRADYPNLPKEIIYLDHEPVEVCNNLQVYNATRFIYSMKKIFEIDSQIRRNRSMLDFL